MDHRNIISKYLLLGLLILLSALVYSDSSADDKQAIVKTASLEVHSTMAEHGKVINRLKRGDIVEVVIEMEGSGGKWCGIADKLQSDIMGYVPCRELDYIENRRTNVWKEAGSSDIDKRTREKQSKESRKNSTKAKAIRPYSAVTVLLYKTPG